MAMRTGEVLSAPTPAEKIQRGLAQGILYKETPVGYLLFLCGDSRSRLRRLTCLACAAKIFLRVFLLDDSNVTASIEYLVPRLRASLARRR